MSKPRTRQFASLQLNIDEILKVTAGELDDAMFAGGEVFADAIERHVPRSSGEMANSIYVAAGKRSTYKDGPERERERTPPPGGAVVGVAAFYAHFLESGVGPHTITSRTPQGMLKLYGGTYAVSVQHPGFPARPFMRPAYDEARDAAAQASADHLKDALQKRVK